MLTIRLTQLRMRRMSRFALLLALVLLVLAGSSVALAQSSFGYDLACRNTLTAGGGVLTTPSGALRIVTALGQPVAGSSQSANHGVRGGYLQPFSSARTAATPVLPPDGMNAPNTPHSTSILLPIVSNLTRVIRGGC